MPALKQVMEALTLLMGKVFVAAHQTSARHDPVARLSTLSVSTLQCFPLRFINDEPEIFVFRLD